MTSSLLYLVIAVLTIYAIACQFMEQQVTWFTLLLLPALSAYGSYTEWQTEFSAFQSRLASGRPGSGTCAGSSDRSLSWPLHRGASG